MTSNIFQKKHCTAWTFWNMWGEEGEEFSVFPRESELLCNQEHIRRYHKKHENKYILVNGYRAQPERRRK